MKKTGWKVLGSESDMRIAEFQVTSSNENVSSYDNAKATALRTLREHIEPYLRRIDTLEQDQFRTTGSLPRYKAWRSPRCVVTAKTKKRAIEIFGWSRYSFDSEFSEPEAEGDWWYSLATKEAFWIEVKDDNGVGIGHYLQPVLHEIADKLLEDHLLPYKTMSLDLSQFDQPVVTQGITTQGTPYTITTTISESTCNEDSVAVFSCLEDLAGCRAVRYIEIPKESVMIDWKMEGF